MVEFAYNNAKNASKSYIFFELNYRYYFYIFYEKDLDFCSKTKVKEKLFFELQKLITISQQNIYYAQKF